MSSLAPITFECIANHLGIDVSNIIMQYVHIGEMDWHKMALNGEYEACLQCPYKNQLLLKVTHLKQQEAVKLLVWAGATNINEAMEGAVLRNDVTLIQWFIANGATEFDTSLHTSIICNLNELTPILLSCPIKEWDTHIHTACKYNSHDVLRQIFNKHCANVNDASIIAASFGHLQCVQLLVERGANNFNEMFGRACYHNRIFVLEFLKPYATKCTNCRKASHQHFFGY